MPAYQWILLLLGSGGLVYISRNPLKDPKSHGFYRFFAWESLLALFALNIEGWFRNLFTWYQLISWTLLFIALALVIEGFRLLRGMGQQNESRADPTLFPMEKTARLVTVGLYRYIRHPLYSSLLFLGWGMFFKSPGWIDLALALLCTVSLVLTALVEERENIRYFGEAYTVYVRKTRMFVPFIF